MVVLGILLMVIGALAVAAALFTASGTVELLGFDVNAMAMFFIGLGAGLAILWGFGFSKWGTKRSMRQRRENKRMADMARQVDRHEAEKRREDNTDPDRSF